MDASTKRQGHSLSWHNLEINIKGEKTTTTTRKILSNISGEANPGELTCILGLSGSGKTSLLQYLAGRMEPSPNLECKGDIYLNGKPIKPTSPKLQSKVAYVEQRDTLLATATPREAIYFSARLRLPRSVSDQEIHQLTNNILDQLRLLKVADSLIGGEHFRGLSGGEMRRVSLGVQLAVSPCIILCDEVTSGLDSNNAATVMEICKDVATRGGATILMVIHQPSSEIFAMMDQLILLDHGRCKYRGQASKAVDYFATKGFQLPNQFNPAEWILKVALQEQEKAPEGKSTLFSTDFGFDDEEESSQGSDHTALTSSTTASMLYQLEQENSRTKATMSTQLVQQLQRDVRTLYRDGNGMLMRFGMIVGSSTLSAITFTNVGSNSLKDPASFSSHVGAIFFLLLGTTLILQLTLFDFIGVRDLYIQEIRTNHYNMLTFGLTKVGMDLCLVFVQAVVVVLIVYWALDLNMRLWWFIMVMFLLTMVNVSMSYLLGSLPKDPRIAKEFIALIILPQLLFSGFFVTPDSLPVWISWLTYLMPTTYAFRLVLADEFATCVDYTPVQQQLLNCLQVLTNVEQNSLGDLVLFSEEHINTFAADDFTITIAETGQFGKDTGVVEYLNLISPEQDSFIFTDACEIAGSRNLFFYPSKEPKQCSFVNGAVQQGFVTKDYRRNDIDDDDQFVQFFVGTKFQFSYSDDLQSAELHELDVYAPQALYDTAIEEQIDTAKVAREICRSMEDYCPSTWANNSFAGGQQECVTKMSSLPTTTVNARNQTTLDGNSTGCRILHNGLVKVDSNHCPHLSYIPQEDVNGQIKCSESYNRHSDDLFTPEDYSKLMMASEEHGFDVLDRAIQLLPKEEAATCRYPTDPVEPESFRHLPFPPNYFCAQYLHAQDATGSENVIYWVVLVSMFVILRLASLVALKARAFNNKRPSFLPGMGVLPWQKTTQADDDGFVAVVKNSVSSGGTTTRKTEYEV